MTLELCEPQLNAIVFTGAPQMVRLARTSSQVRDSGTRWAAPRKGHGNWRRRLFQQRRG